MERSDLEDIYPLSPLQQGMLFHHLEARHRGVYLEQFVCDLEGALDADAFEEAWRRVVARHPALRTAFVWQKVRQPVQAVHRRVEIELERRDWSAVDDAERERRWRQLLERDLEQGFDLKKVPLLRLHLVRLGDELHRFALSYPHLLLDGWSLGLVIEDLLAFYRAVGGDEAVELPPVRPFRDHIVWLKQRDEAAAEAYWRQTLAGFREANAVGLEPPRHETGTMASRTDAVDGEATAALQALARHHGLTLNILVQGLWALLVGRRSGRSDVVFGTISSGRPPELRGVERMVGLFINTVPVRARLAHDRPLVDWLQELQRAQSERLRHEHTPLLDIQRWSEVPAPRPLFETLVIFENYPIPEVAPGDDGPRLALAGADVEERSNYPLALGVRPGDRLYLRLFYDRQRLGDAAALRVLDHYRRLLHGLLENPAARPGDLSLLSPGERHQLRLEWNDTAAPAALRPLPETFAARAAGEPHSEAAVFGDRRLDYRQLDRRAAALAARLRGHGVGAEVLVGIFLDRSLELPVAIHAVMKAGGAFLPLDPTYPDERLRFMLADSGARVVLTSAALEPRLAALGDRLQPVVVERADPEASDDSRTGESSNTLEDSRTVVDLDQLAYMIYTSGSTGRPKGVQLGHRGLANLAAYLEQFLARVGPGKRVLQFSALSFDAAVWEFAMAYGSGAAWVLAPAAELMPGRPLAELLASHRIAAATLPPSVALLLPPADLPALETLVVAGEPCSAELVARWAGSTRFWNAYGPTETTVCATAERCRRRDAAAKPSIGWPIANARVHLVDPGLRLMSIGLAGELLIGGRGLARGYFGRPALTARSFVPDPFGGEGGARLYRSGDLARRLPGGEIDFLGRVDHQVKVRGFRIEPGEIETALRAADGVGEAVVEARGERLIAWWVAAEDGPAETAPGSAALRRQLETRLPAHMVPSVFVRLEALPRLPSDKIDRGALARRPLPGAERSKVELGSRHQRVIAAIWRQVLEVEQVGPDDNFFDLGGHSLAMVRVHGQLEEELGREIPLVELLWHPTVRALARHLDERQAGRDAERAGDSAAERGAARARRRRDASTGGAVAVVGLACRFPQAEDAAAFWRNLEGGVEAITFFSEEELLAAGVPAEQLRDPAYVKAKGWLEGGDAFDHTAFGISPREAQMLDPQHRLLLECAWHTLEDGGVDPRRTGEAIGLFAGAAMNTYWFNLVSNREFLATADPFQAMLGNDKDFLTTRVSYKLGLRGPSVDVQTACSTSLVAVHLAAQSLLRGECELALAGGVTVGAPRKSGYLYRQEGIFSPDGHCRTFDARARGTVGGEGVGLVLLKPLERAVADRDAIRAVVRGSAINNDGAMKVGFAAPSVEGQAEVIGEALEIAGVEPGEITLVEAHGSGTALGDPIEVAALHQVFKPRTTQRRYCALGAVKTSIGHTDAAAGIAGLIKTVLALEAKTLPPSLNFEQPNPKIDFDDSPFFVPTEARPWQAEAPRRAGVSAFGLGGTNVHVVVEEAPARVETETAETDELPARTEQLLLLSAHDEAALEAASERLAAHLEAHEMPLADVAYTLHSGRQQLPLRRAVVAAGRESAAAIFAGRDGGRLDGAWDGQTPPVVFMFSGLGDHAVGMARGLYRSETVFRHELDRAAERLEPLIGCDLRQLLYPAGAGGESAGASAGKSGGGPDLRRLLGRTHRDDDPAWRRLRDTRLAQPAVFAIEIALARLWQSWGVEPQAVIGYSLGEYAAACIAGVFDSDEALTLVAERARLISGLPAGGMLAAALGESEIRPFIDRLDELALAATNGPQLSVVSGPEEALDRLAAALDEDEIVWRRLENTHAFHSPMMRPIVERFRAALAGVRLQPPRLPCVSNVSGTWLGAEEATDPEYWVRHLLGTVRFAEGLETLFGDGLSAGTGSGSTGSGDGEAGDDRAEGQPLILLEVGPGQALATTARQHPAIGPEHRVLASLRDPREPISDTAFLLQTVGRLWLLGVGVEAERLYAGRHHRVRLPLYPFQRHRFWVEAGELTASAAPSRSALHDWFYIPSWSRGPALEPTPHADGPWLLFSDGSDLAGEVAGRLDRPFVVEAGEGFERRGERRFTIDPQAREHYDLLLESVEKEGAMPARIAHLWGLAPAGGAWPQDADRAARAQGFFSLLWLAQALGRRTLPAAGLEILVTASGLFSVLGDEALRPTAATVLGICLGLPREMPGVGCRLIEIAARAAGSDRAELAGRLLDEWTAGDGAIVALRGRHRWLREWRPVRYDERPQTPPRLRRGGTYLITGGLGGMGLAIAAHLARTLAPRLALLQRRELPPRQGWTAWLDEPGEDDATARTLRALLDLEAAGAEVEVLRADVADREQMAAAAERLGRRFGRVDGIFHTAGVPGGGLIQRQEPEKVQQAWAPKIDGTLNLAELFGESAEVFVLASSLVSVVGLPDRAEYAAANAFLDTFAQSREGTIAINWDSWIGTAMGVRDSAAGNGMTPEEGVEALLRVLHHREPQVAISTFDLPALIEHFDRLEPDEILAQMVGDRGGASALPRPRLATAYRAPGNATEEILARIWGQLLGLEQVGVDDNFLELGGDSILSLQVIARARQEGVHVSLGQIFERPTIARLAEVAGSSATVVAEQGAVTGEVALTPIQRWFFEQQLPVPDHWNQSLLLAATERLDPAALQRALVALSHHHDALRMRYEAAEDGWRQWIEGPATRVPQLVVDLAALDRGPGDHSLAVEAAAAQLQGALDLRAGRLFLATLFEFGAAAGGGRLLFVVHHLVIDAVSWRVVLADLETAYRQALAGAEIELPPKTTSLQRWSEQLQAYVRDGGLDDSVDYWLAPERQAAAPLPRDLDRGVNTMASRRTVDAALGAEETRALRREVRQIYDGEIDDILLSALARTLIGWTGRSPVLVDLEGHGREPLFEDVDLSRTVGWMTSLYPFLLALDDKAQQDPGRALLEIQQQRRRLVLHGIGYGLLRYLSPDAEVRRALAAQGEAELSFVFLGRVEQGGSAGDALLSFAGENPGPEMHPQSPRPHLLDLTGAIVDDRLQLTWAYSAGRHRRDTVERLAQDYLDRLRELLHHCRAREEGRYAVSHFPQAKLDEDALDELIGELELPEE